MATVSEPDTLNKSVPATTTTPTTSSTDPKPEKPYCFPS